MYSMSSLSQIHHCLNTMVSIDHIITTQFKIYRGNKGQTIFLKRKFKLIPIEKSVVMLTVEWQQISYY